MHTKPADGGGPGLWARAAVWLGPFGDSEASPPLLGLQAHRHQHFLRAIPLGFVFPGKCSPITGLLYGAEIIHQIFGMCN